CSGGPCALQRLYVVVDYNGGILRHAYAQLTKCLKRTLSDLVAAEQHGFGQGVILCRALCKGVAALSAYLADVEKPLVISVAAFQYALKSFKSVHADTPVGTFVYSTDIAKISVALFVQQIFNNLLMTALEVYLHLVELVTLLVRIHEHYGK